MVSGHIAFKTKEIDWLHTSFPVVILISIDSKFNEGIDGYFKMGAFLSTIRDHVQGKIIALIADAAHLHTKNLSQSEDSTHQKAEELIRHNRSYFEGIEIRFWNSEIMKNESYTALKESFQALIHTDGEFKSFLLADAEMAYTEKRQKEFPNKELFLEKMKDDLIEQCISLQILAKLGFRYLFYPGPPCISTEYVKRNCFQLKNDLQWIDVFVSIEKKTKLSQ